MPSKKFSMLAAAVALALLLAGCSGDSATSSPSAPKSSVTPSSPPSARPAPSAPAARPSQTTPPAKARPAKPRTAAELRKALIVLTDLPPGFVIDPARSDDDDGERMSSSKPGCSRLVALSNAEQTPGAKAYAERGYSATGRYISQTVEAMGSAREVAAAQESFRTAIRNCRSVFVTGPATRRFTMTVQEASAPQFGTNPFAVRYTVTSGGQKGLQIHIVITGVGDILVGILVMGGLPRDPEGATRLAVDRTRAALGGAKTGT